MVSSIYPLEPDSAEFNLDNQFFFNGLWRIGDRGSQITLIGLFANVGLTIAKGAAGWYMHSASLLADAGHSMSGMCDLAPFFHTREF